MEEVVLVLFSFFSYLLGFRHYRRESSSLAISSARSVLNLVNIVLSRLPHDMRDAFVKEWKKAVKDVLIS